MTEQPARSDSAIFESDDAFDDWIGGATIASRSVPIYGKPGLKAEYEDLERQLAVAEAASEERSIGDTGVDDILDKMEALYEQWQASKSTWTLYAIEDEKVKEIQSSVTFPDPPPTLAEDAGPEARSVHEAVVKKYDDDYAQADDDANLRILEAAVKRIEFADGRMVHGITATQLRSLRKTLGSRQIVRLLQAATLAAIEETEIPAPFSRRSSKTDQT